MQTSNRVHCPGGNGRYNSTSKPIKPQKFVTGADYYNPFQKSLQEQQKIRVTVTCKCCRRQKGYIWKSPPAPGQDLAQSIEGVLIEEDICSKRLRRDPPKLLRLQRRKWGENWTCRLARWMSTLSQQQKCVTWSVCRGPAWLCGVERTLHFDGHV